MSVQRRHAARASELISQGTPFVQATVVRAQCPTSARPGDSAIVLADGSIEGFVGGQCAEGSVRLAAVPLLETNETLLLRILPEGDADFPESEGAMTVVNPCLSGGAIEVFLEPKLPAPRVTIVGNTPIAEGLELFAAHLGFSADRDTASVPEVGGSLAVIISSHGRHEPETIRAALDAGVRYIGLVASATRGAAVLEELDLTPAERAIVRSPVGIDIGARTAEEIALSILADLVRAVRIEGLTAPATTAPPRPESAIDPVCGMTVMIGLDTPHLLVDGTDHWFCNPGCRTRYADELGVTT
ncbi:MAG: carbon monoxide dehydrogenase accessory protein [Actinomycetia bacterium]|nr:carbon monoxide dehydrogenase accessory protein [Actinomycetes bacterium]